jgi:hypothetical protein
MSLIKSSYTLPTMFPNIHYPFERMKYRDYRHIVAFKPNGCIQIDYFRMKTKVANDYKIAYWYTIGVDVYSRYVCIHVNEINEEGDIPDDPKTKGPTFLNFRKLIELFTDKPDMITADAEFNVEDVRDYCKENGIKLVIFPTGTINSNNVVEKMIHKVKKTFLLYVFAFDDIIQKRLENPNISRKKHSYRIFNSICYFLNRKFNTGVKGIPIEIYMGIESPNLPLNNNYTTIYPKHKIGDYVILRPRGRYKSLTFQARADAPGMLGEIIANPTRHTYTIRTLQGEEINAKPYEFIIISEEDYNKFKKMPIFK